MKTWQWILVPLLVACAGAWADQEAIYRQTGNIAYDGAGGEGLLLDVFAPVKPDGVGKGLGIVCVVSGAYKSDDAMLEAHRTFGFFDVLCGFGYTVFAVRPGTLSLFTAEQMLDHIHAVIRYVKLHAPEYGVDANRLGLTGASSGGNLALLAATRWARGDLNAADPLKRLDTQVRAVGVFCPPTDFLNWDAKGYGLNLMEGKLVFPDGFGKRSKEQIDAAAKAISPIYHVNAGLPPFLLIHGDADSLVPVEQSVKFVDAVKEAGGSAELILKKGGDHSWPTVRQEIAKMAEWFAGKLAPEGK